MLADGVDVSGAAIASPMTPTCRDLLGVDILRTALCGLV